MAIRRGPGPAGSALAPPPPPPFTLSRVKGILGSGSLACVSVCLRSWSNRGSTRCSTRSAEPFVKTSNRNSYRFIRRPQRGFVYTATGRIIDRRRDFLTTLRFFSSYSFLSSFFVWKGYKLNEWKLIKESK